VARSAWPAAFASIVALGAILLSPAAATAATGGAPTPAGAPPPPPSRGGAPDAAPSAGSTLTLLSATTSPRKSFYYGVRYPRLTYSIDSDQAQNDLRIDVIDANGGAVKSFFRNDVAPNLGNSIRWDGTTSENRPAANGHYSFRIAPQTSGPSTSRASRLRASSSSGGEPFSLGFDLYAYAFPVLGAHDFGDAGARFGAARFGHTHEGQDVMAKCGTPLVAARGGRVQYSGYQAAAGNYVVIDGKGTGYDMGYMHLLEPSPLQEGAAVRTGEPIGIVGQTGDATACHLHFEIWTAPGWYEGGSPIDPLPFLKQWDEYS
jgi:murein DD-endopeptidase MepM/ murein hydrolase activator NlpD